MRSWAELWQAGATAAEAAAERGVSVIAARQWSLRSGLRWDAPRVGDEAARLVADCVRRAERSNQGSVQEVDRGGPYPAPNADDCRALWAAVLLEMWRLAVVDDVVRTGQGLNRTSAERDQAQAWFGSRDFHLVCLFCGMDGDAVLRAYRAGVRPGANVRKGGEQTDKRAGRAA